MLPVGPLMVEHRLIERMIALMAKEVNSMKQGHAANTEFIRTAVDFIRTYADKLHHGKEEDILFRDLAKKPLSAEHKRIMDELVKDHARGREQTKKLLDARNRYAGGRKEALKDIVGAMETLADFYPGHIDKEDKHFFLPVMEYFSKEEQAAMLKEFFEFDRKFIHRRYEAIVAASE